MTYTTQPVAVTMRDGYSVGILRVFTSAPANALDTVVAEALGYSIKVSDDGASWYWGLDEVTAEFVERELANMPSFAGFVRWRFVSEDEIPEKGENRNALVDTGEALVYR